ncbi:MAG: hypothetical protein IPJ32_10495 [Sphingobacteriaceae bacterium]|nr:hypothetical protein [Sphingobacteriaceae bacterium]
MTQIIIWACLKAVHMLRSVEMNTYCLTIQGIKKSPLRSVAEELPIKVAIHFADTGGFSHKELISQVYEFSRLYWKGLKQRSQPATTIYAKLIAEFAAHSNGTLPDNETVHNSPWFL